MRGHGRSADRLAIDMYVGRSCFISWRWKFEMIASHRGGMRGGERKEESSADVLKLKSPARARKW